jgi:hypothetical protein
MEEKYEKAPKGEKISNILLEVLEEVNYIQSSLGVLSKEGTTDESKDVGNNLNNRINDVLRLAKMLRKKIKETKEFLVVTTERF